MLWSWFVDRPRKPKTMPRPRIVDHQFIFGGVVTERHSPIPLEESVHQFLYKRGCEVLEYAYDRNVLSVVFRLPDRDAIRHTVTSDLVNMEARKDHLFDQLQEIFTR
jgi:hypothetical protein